MPDGVVVIEEDLVLSHPKKEIGHDLVKVPEPAVREGYGHRYTRVDIFLLGGTLNQEKTRLGCAPNERSDKGRVRQYSKRPAVVCRPA